MTICIKQQCYTQLGLRKHVDVTYVHVCVYIYTHISIHTYTYIQAYIHVYIYTHNYHIKDKVGKWK